MRRVTKRIRVVSTGIVFAFVLVVQAALAADLIGYWPFDGSGTLTSSCTTAMGLSSSPSPARVVGTSVG
jgi:hypothetical protein